GEPAAAHVDIEDVERSELGAPDRRRVKRLEDRSIAQPKHRRHVGLREHTLRFFDGEAVDGKAWRWIWHEQGRCRVVKEVALAHEPGKEELHVGKSMPLRSQRERLPVVSAQVEEMTLVTIDRRARHVGRLQEIALSTPAGKEAEDSPRAADG